MSSCGFQGISECPAKEFKRPIAISTATQGLYMFETSMPITHPNPRKDPKNGTPKPSPSCPNVVMGSYRGVPCFGSFRGSGQLASLAHDIECPADATAAACYSDAWFCWEGDMACSQNYGPLLVIDYFKAPNI